MKKEQYLNELENILSYKGAMVSSSKSCGPPMAIYNANVVIDEEVVWYGDVDLEKPCHNCTEDNPISVRHGLIYLSGKLGKPIDVYYEHSLRMFNFEEDDKKAGKVDIENKKKQLSTIRERKGLAWSTLAPDKMGSENMDYNEYKDEMTETKNENIKKRMIWNGSLTPYGAEWKWYNRLFYKSIYKIYHPIVVWFKVYPGYAIQSVKYHRYTSFWKKIKCFFLCMVREVGYQHGLTCDDPDIDHFTGIKKYIYTLLERMKKIRTPD